MARSSGSRAQSAVTAPCTRWTSRAGRASRSRAAARPTDVWGDARYTPPGQARADQEEDQVALKPLKIAPTGMRLHEWIALERGYFQDEGIEPIVRWDIVSGIMAAWDGRQYKE